MKKKLCLFLLIYVFFLNEKAIATPIQTPNMNSFSNVQLQVNNKILATINDIHISVLDVMKKMDATFYQAYPNLVDS